MRSNCSYTHSTSFLHNISSLSDSTSCINHIVNNDNVLILHITNNLNSINDIGTCTSLVTEYKWTTKILSVSISTLRTTYVRTCNNYILQVKALNVRQKNTTCIEMVNRNIEETLNLVSVQVHCHQTVDTSYTQQVSY